MADIQGQIKERRTNNEKHYRLGDLIIEEVETIPSEVLKRGKTVMEGEATGHTHRIGSGAIVLETAAGERYIEVTAGKKPVEVN